MNKNIAYYKDLIKKHLFSFLIVFTIIFSLVLVYAYFAQKVYQSSATVEIIKYKQNTNLSNNPLQIAVKESSPEDESEILKSNLLINKAIKGLNFHIEYYDFYRKKNHAIEEENFPLIISKFEVKNRGIYNNHIQINQIDKNNYQIFYDSSSFMKKIKGSPVIKIDEKYEYGKTYSNDYFTIQIDKKTLK